ncbi:MAG TPA: cellulase family glycosylhydrolase [Micromonosporaceae bacterium]
MTHNRMWTAAIASLVVVAASTLVALNAGPAASSAPAGLRVQGNHLVDGRGRTVRLLGVNRSGAEYMCLQHGNYADLFDGPTDTASIRAMKGWHVNTVRLPLNETCWLGINGVPRGGSRYRTAISKYVHRMNRAGLFVVLDLHVAAPGTNRAKGIIPMADADHAPAFWRSVGHTFKFDRRVLFDLYNEPHDISWACWRNGCPLPAGGSGEGRHPAYRTAGMQQLIDAVRSAGATQPAMAGGIDWARSLGGWLSHRPRDPAGRLVAAEHNYGQLANCWQQCKAAITQVARRFPVVIGELGETDCKHGYIDRWMPYADRRGLSYLGWTWNATAPGSWTCGGGPSLIERWSGRPTPYGVGFKNHFARLARH